jgi:ribosomal protein S18 acetylase RimI-like enzyme
MTNARVVDDRSVIERALRQNAPMNIFGLCDLDSREAPRTTWFATSGLEESALGLIFDGPEGPLVVIHGRKREGLMLLDMGKNLLPRRFHLSMEGEFGEAIGVAGLTIVHAEDFIRMVPGEESAQAHRRNELIPLEESDFERIRELLVVRAAYPTAWFKQHTLGTGLYRGWSEDGQITGVVGVHAASDEFGAAVVGNLAVDPRYRGKGIGRVLMESILWDLRQRGWAVAFNVRPDNHSARRLYRQMGCREVGCIREFEVEVCAGGASSGQ